MTPSMPQVDQAKQTQPPTKFEHFGDLTPWAEPAWYSTLSSPYYNDSHRKLRSFVRQYIDDKILPYADDWEKKGKVPMKVRCNQKSEMAFIY